MRILIVDDEKIKRITLADDLSAEGHEVVAAADGEEGAYKARPGGYDAIVLDLMLPRLDGWQVLARLRPKCRTPVLMLTARDAVTDRVKGLNGGADDYLTKPFGTAELLARLRVLLRRTPGAGDEPVHVVGPLQMDFAAHLVRVADQEINLTATEFALLRVLVQHAGRVVTHKFLLRAVWGPAAEAQSQYLRVYITHLRRKLETGIKQRLIRTETGIGYRLLWPE